VALREAITVFGSEAAVLFAVENAAKTKLAAMVRLFRLLMDTWSVLTLLRFRPAMNIVPNTT
jgi:hypothetical protein